MKFLFSFLALLLLLAIASAQAPPPPSAVLTWTAPTTNTDGTPIIGAITYNVYQGLTAASLVQVATGVTALTQTITTGLVDGTTYYWSVTAVAGGNESARSNVVSKVFAAGTPNTVTLTVK